MPDDDSEASGAEPDLSSPALPKVVGTSHLGVGQALPPPMAHRSRALYDPETGKLDVKKLGAWLGGLAAVVGALSAGAAKAEEGVRWWLELDALQARVEACEAGVSTLNEQVNPRERPRDANARLDQALPRISHELRYARKDRQRHEHSLVRLSTIHEYGLTRSREREAAREARESIQWRRNAAPSAETSAEPEVDSIDSLSDL